MTRRKYLIEDPGPGKELPPEVADGLRLCVRIAARIMRAKALGTWVEPDPTPGDKEGA